MPTAEKTAVIEELRQTFDGAAAIFLADFTGLDVESLTHLRRKCRENGVKLEVVKNTLAKRALKGTSYEVLTAHFEGATAIAYTDSDPVGLAKTLTTFMKTAPALQIKAAVVQGQAIKAAEVTDLANMPGKPE